LRTHPPLLPRLPGSLLLLAALTTACTTLTGGDPPSKPVADDLGDGQKISEIQGPAPWVTCTKAAATTPACPPGSDDVAGVCTYGTSSSDACALSNYDSTNCAYPCLSDVYVSGATVTAVDKYDETMNGKSIGNLYFEDTSASPVPYSGSVVFDPSYSPPNYEPQIGDIVDVLGNYSEFPGPICYVFSYCETQPEFAGTLSFRFAGTPLTPVTVPIATLQPYPSARPYLGLLVRVEDVEILSGNTSDDGRYQVTIGTGANGSDTALQISNELYDLVGQGPALPTGAKFASVTGLVTYFAGFHIAPRSPADFEN
jgi:hypothetical protein